MYTKTEVDKYELGVYVKDTNKENGPGHVSGFVRKTKNGETVTYHTSFYPKVLGSMINGLTLGSVPVFGQVSQDHQADLHEAEHVLIKTIDEKQFKSVRAAQKEFNKDVERGRRAYSVFGTMNPLASIMSTALSTVKAAHISAHNHKVKTGFHPPEDICGIHVYDDESNATPEKIIVDNCTTSVTHLIKKAGVIGFDNPNVPTFFTSELQKHGFKKVDKEEHRVTHSTSLK